MRITFGLYFIGLLVLTFSLFALTADDVSVEQTYDIIEESNITGALKEVEESLMYSLKPSENIIKDYFSRVIKVNIHIVLYSIYELLLPTLNFILLISFVYPREIIKWFLIVFFVWAFVKLIKPILIVYVIVSDWLKEKKKKKEKYGGKKK